MNRSRQVRPFSDIPSPRAAMPESAVAERVAGFTEAEKGFTEGVARTEARRCLSCRGCLGCGLCAVVCKPRAIDFLQCDEELEVTADEVVVTPGVSPVAPALDQRFGYGLLPDVLTAPELEQMLGEQGPYGGVVLRPSDGDVPGRLAFVACDLPHIRGAASLAESRQRTLDYALNLAAMALTRLDRSAAVVVHPDLNLCRGEKPGIGAAGERMASLCGEVVSVREEAGKLKLGVTQQGRANRIEECDMLVLCSGLLFSAGVVKWGDALGLRLEQAVFWPAEASRTIDAGAEHVVLSGVNLLSGKPGAARRGRRAEVA